MFLIEYREGKFIDAERIEYISVTEEVGFTLSGNSNTYYHVDAGLVGIFINNLQAINNSTKNIESRYRELRKETELTSAGAEEGINDIHLVKKLEADLAGYVLTHKADCEYIQRLEKDAARYKWLRERDINQIKLRGIFAGKTPDNIVLNGEDLDSAIDKEMALSKEEPDEPSDAW